MSSTKAEKYFGLIFVSAICVILLTVVGISLYNAPDVDLDEESQEYVLSYSSYVDESGYSSLGDTEIGTNAQKNILIEDNDTGEIISTDYFSQIKYTQGKLIEVPNFLKLAFRLPNLIVLGLNIKTTGFNIYINVLGSILIYLISLTVVKLILNGGNS